MDGTLSSSLLLVGTSDYCFFCLESKEPGQFQNGGVFSLQSLLHYLNLDREKGKHGAKSQTESVFTCETCSKLLLKFQNLFHLWLEVEMKMGVCLGEIREQLKSNDGENFSASKVKDDPRPHKLRKQIERQCAVKSLTFQPQTILIANDPEVEFKLKQLQVKTESLDLVHQEDFSDHDNFSFSPEPDVEPEVEKEPVDCKYGGPSSPPNSEDESGIRNDLDPGMRPKNPPRSKFKEFHYKIRQEASGRHVCQLCNRGFKQLRHCRKHFRWEHLGRRPEFKCNECDIVFNSSTSYYEHTRAMHKGVSFHCSHCQKRFTTKSDRIRHEIHNCPRNRAAAQTTTAAHPKVKMLRCDLCDREYARKDSLRRHQYMIHLGGKFC